MITHLLQPLFPIDPTLSMARVSYMCHSDVFLKEIYFESKDSHLKKKQDNALCENENKDNVDHYTIKSPMNFLTIE